MIEISQSEKSNGYDLVEERLLKIEEGRGENIRLLSIMSKLKSKTIS